MALFTKTGESKHAQVHHQQCLGDFSKSPGLQKSILLGFVHNEPFPNSKQPQLKDRHQQGPNELIHVLFTNVIIEQNPSTFCHWMHWLLALASALICFLPLVGECQSRLELCLSKVWLRLS